MYQLLARMFGSNNLPDSSNMCHESIPRTAEYCRFTGLWVTPRVTLPAPSWRLWRASVGLGLLQPDAVLAEKLDADALQSRAHLGNRFGGDLTALKFEVGERAAPDASSPGKPDLAPANQ